VQELRGRPLEVLQVASEKEEVAPQKNCPLSPGLFPSGQWAFLRLEAVRLAHVGFPTEIPDTGALVILVGEYPPAPSPLKPKQGK